MPPLNSKQEAFAKAVAKRESDVAAYRRVYQCSHASAQANAPRLREREEVRQRIAELQNATAAAALLSVQESREWLARTVSLNLFTFDPEADGDLAEEIVEQSGKKRVKIASKRACIMDDARLAGELNGDTATATASVAVAPWVMTAERHAELIAKKRAANERMIARRDAQLLLTNGSNGHGAG